MLLSKFVTAGRLVSLRLCRDKITGRSMGHGYVNYMHAADAERAVDNFNFDLMKGRQIRVMYCEPLHAQGQGPLTPAKLYAAAPHEQEVMLGQRLFPLANFMYPYHSGKITGMLLQLDYAELLYMLENNELLKAKVEEAFVLLQVHRNKQATVSKMKKR